MLSIFAVVVEPSACQVPTKTSIVNAVIVIGVATVPREVHDPVGVVAYSK